MTADPSGQGATTPGAGDVLDLLPRSGGPRRDCENCDGRGCMDCVTRTMHDQCRDDCPSCCAPKAAVAASEPSGQCDVCRAPVHNVCAALPDGGKACSARCVDLDRFARAAGHDLDPGDPVGGLEKAIREGREGDLPIPDTAQDSDGDTYWCAGRNDHVWRAASGDVKISALGNLLSNPVRFAQCILAAHAYRAPESARTFAVGDPITTAEELDALPVGAVVRDAIDDLGVRRDEGWNWLSGAFARADSCTFPARLVDLPAEATS